MSASMREFARTIAVRWSKPVSCSHAHLDSLCCPCRVCRWCACQQMRLGSRCWHALWTSIFIGESFLFAIHRLSTGLMQINQLNVHGSPRLQTLPLTGSLETSAVAQMQTNVPACLSGNNCIAAGFVICIIRTPVHYTSSGLPSSLPAT